MKENREALYASAGALFLDLKMPGWAKKIDLGRLNLNWANDCILGQLYDGYDKGVTLLGLFDESRQDDATVGGTSAVLGFTSTHTDERHAGEPECLTVAWKNEIHKRLGRKFTITSVGGTKRTITALSVEEIV